MFRQLPNYLSTGNDVFSPALDPATVLFDRHPIDVAAYVEAYWNKRLPQSSFSPHGMPLAASWQRPSRQYDDEQSSEREHVSCTGAPGWHLRVLALQLSPGAQKSTHASPIRPAELHRHCRSQASLPSQEYSGAHTPLASPLH